MFIKIVLFAALSIGGYSILALVLRLPPGNGRKTFELLRKKIGFRQLIMLSVIAPLSVPLSKVLPMPEKYEASLALDLTRAGIPIKPKEYYARAVVASVMSLTVLLLGVVLGNPLLKMGGIITPFLVFRLMSTIHKDVIKKRMHDMEHDVPHFIRSVLHRVTQTSSDGTVSVDVISVFEDYIRIAPVSLADDVKLLVTEMKSRSVESGLRNFADRLGLPEVRHMASALIALYQGQNQVSAMITLSQEVDTNAREQHRRELNRMPGRIRLATIPVLVIAVISILYVLVVSIFSSYQGI